MTRSDWVRAASLGMAAWLSFVVATALDVDHAFWASMPVWVVAQPWRGVTIERAVWRLVGTVIGGGAGLLLLAVSPAPWVTGLGMSALLAVGAALIHLWSGVRSYMPLMCAITVGVVVVPAMLDPSGEFSLALDRMICTLIGGIAVAVIVAPFTPNADRAGFRSAGVDLADRFIATARLLLAQDASEQVLDDAVADTLRQGAALEARARLVAAGSREGYRRMAALDAILAAGLSVLEAAASAGRDAGARAQAQQVLAADGTRPTPTPEQIGYPAVARLVQARRALAIGVEDLQAVAPSGYDLRRLVPPHDPSLALRGASLAAASGLVGSMLFILTGSIVGELMAFSMVIFALVLGSMPVPQIMAPKLIVGVSIGALAGMLYRIGVQPYTGDWGALVLGLLPFIAVGAVARANPRTAPYALDANMCFMLASQAGAGVAPMPEILGSGAAMVLGALAVVLCVMALPRPSVRLIHKTEAKLQRDLSALVAAGGDDHRWSALWGRRVLTLAMALDAAGEGVPRRLLGLAGDGYEALTAVREARPAP